MTPVGDVDPLAVAAFWERSLDAAGLDPTTPLPPASCFGDTVELADELIDLVLTGAKRATASSVGHLDADGEPVPEVGGLWIANLTARCGPRAARNNRCAHRTAVVG